MEVVIESNSETQDEFPINDLELNLENSHEKIKAQNEELISMKEYICQAAWITTGNLINGRSNLLSIGINPFSSLLFKNVLSRSLGGTKMHLFELYDSNVSISDLSDILYDRVSTERFYVLEQLRIGHNSPAGNCQSHKTTFLDKFLSNNQLLYGIRGLVMMIVLLNTFFMGSNEYGERNQVGVYFFLILLGVIIEFQNINNENSNRKSSYKWSGFIFLRTKFFELFPVYWLALFLCTPRLIIYGSHYHLSMGTMIYSVILYIFGLQTWSNEINKNNLYLGVTIMSLIWGIFVIYTFFRSIFSLSISIYWKSVLCLPYFAFVILLGELNSFHELHPVVGFFYFFLGLLTARMFLWCKSILDTILKVQEQTYQEQPSKNSFFVHIYGINIYYRAKDRFYHFEWQGITNEISSSKYLSMKYSSSKRNKSSKKRDKLLKADASPYQNQEDLKEIESLIELSSISKKPNNNVSEQIRDDDVVPLIQAMHHKPTYYLPLLSDMFSIILLLILFSKSSTMNSNGFGDTFLHFAGLPVLFIIFLALVLLQSIYCGPERGLFTAILMKGHLFYILGECSYPLYLLQQIIVSFWFEFFIEGLNENQFPYTRRFIFNFLENSHQKTLLMNNWYIKLIGIFIAVVFSIFVQRIFYDDVVGYLQYQLLEYYNTKRCSDALTKVNLAYKTDYFEMNKPFVLITTSNQQK